MPEAIPPQGSRTRSLEEILASARARLEKQALYRKPLRRRTPVVVWPWFFKLPPFRRYVAYELAGLIVLSDTPERLIARKGEQWLENLLVHELCHVWQLQHHPVRMTLALLRYRYPDSPYEQQARAATRAEG